MAKPVIGAMAAALGALRAGADLEVVGLLPGDDRYLVISSDTHAGPPSAAYRIDPRHREAFEEDLESAVMLRSTILSSASEEQEKFRVEWEQETGDGGTLASYDPAARNAELDREGVAGEVIFPDADVLGKGASAPFSAGLQSSGELDGELVMAGARAHNRWLAELCSDSPERRCGVAVIPILYDVAAAVAEMSRAAASGLRAMMIPTLWGRRPAYHGPVYEEVWAAGRGRPGSSTATRGFGSSSPRTGRGGCPT